jgi:glycosyltransferase involved in cell wall biosynthesis
MKISVIIPVYKVADYIEKCLLSVLNQSWQELEVIMVDDCSPDHSMEIVRTVTDTHPRGNVVTCLTHETNKGLSAARNTGTEAATGAYIYYLDSDDYLPLDALTTLGEIALTEHPDFVIGAYETVGGESFAIPLQMPTGVVTGNQNIILEFLHDRWYTMACNKLLNREFLLRNHITFQVGMTAEDEYWSLQLAMHSEKMCVRNHVTYYYVMQPNSIVHSVSRHKLESMIAIVTHIHHYILSQGRKDDPLLNNYLEKLKVRSFEALLYSQKHILLRTCYHTFRAIRLLPTSKLLFGRELECKHRLLAVHYLLPPSIGYYYYFLAIQFRIALRKCISKLRNRT